MTPRRFRALTLPILAVFAAAAPVLAGPTRDIVKHVPKDAWGFAVVRSVDTIDQNIGQLQELGLPIPPMQLGAMLQGPPMNLGDAVDTARPVCVVMMDATKFGQLDEKSPPDPGNAAAVLVPAKDPKALMDKLGVAEASGGVRKLKVMDEEMYAAAKGDYLIVGKSERTVKAVATPGDATMAVGDARGELLDATDVYVSASVTRVFGAYREMVMPVLQMALMATDPEGKQAKQFEKMANEMDAIDIGLRLNGDGVALRGLIVPKADSDLELWFKDMKNHDSSLLGMLPKEQYLVAYGATANYSDHAQKFGNQNPISTMLKMAQLANYDEKVAKSMDAEIIKMTKSAKAGAISFSALSGAGQGYIGVACVIEAEKPDAFVESLRKVYTSMWQISTDPELQKAKSMLVHTADAETVEGGKVDTISVKTKEFTEELEMSPDDMKVFKSLFGTDVTARFGAVGDKHVVVTFGGGKDRFAAVAKLIKSGGDTLAGIEGIQATGGHLASPRAMEMFVAVDNIIRLVKTISTEMEDDAIPFEVPNINAPAGFDSAMSDGVVRFDMFIPMKLINAVKKAADEAQKHEMEAFDEADDSDTGMDSQPDTEKGDDEDMGG